MSSAVRFAAMIPASCAVTSASPFGRSRNTCAVSAAIRTRADATAQTGVEMEALTAASVAALTVYDMAKAVDKEMVIEDVKLLEKTKT